MAGKYISEPGDVIDFQERLVSVPGYRHSTNVFPNVESSADALASVLSTGGYKGNDWEFRPDLTPTICAVTSLDRVYSVPWTEEYKRTLGAAMRSGLAPDGTRYKWVAHSTVGADKAVADKAFGFISNLDDWDDSMLSHYLNNQHLCKGSDKEESDDAGSLGFMSLWHCASRTTDFQNWKDCTRSACPGSDLDRPGYSRIRPCPLHSPMSYCGIDALVSPLSHIKNMEALRAMGMQDWFYRDMMTMSEICWKMEKTGVKVDLPYVIKTNAIMDEKKDAMFEFTGAGKKREYALFNPRSSAQTIEWFDKNGIKLSNTRFKTVAEAVDTYAKKEGFINGAKSLEDNPELPVSTGLQQLITLKQYKTEGKGLDPWFSEKYFGDEYHAALKTLGIDSIYDVKDKVIFSEMLRMLSEHSYVHPRFVLTGTSTGRLSSSGPNLQNVPRRGVFGELVRQAILPHDPSSQDLIKSDFSQLEFRIVLYLAGEPYTGADVFNWMVEQTGDNLFNAAKEFDPVKYAKDPFKAARDITKSVAHGCVTGDHEILTRSGWIKIDDWKGQDIAEWSTSGIEFKQPLKYHRYAPTSVYSVTGPAFSQSVTSNHRFPVLSSGTWKGRVYNTWRDDTVESWEDFKTGRIPVAGKHENDEVYEDLDLLQAIAIQADGTRIDSQTWRFHVKKDRKVKRLTLLFGEEPTLYKDGTYGLTVKFNSPLLSDDKKLTWEFLRTSVRQKELCLEEATLWDGSRLKTSQVYRNSCIQSVDVIQTLAHLSGHQSKVNSSGVGGFEGSTKEVFTVSINNRSFAAKEVLKISQVSDQEVYCFTTDSGYFLVRHNGHISVTGNSNYGEGLVLLSPVELDQRKNQALIKAGALKVYKDWEFFGKIVAFTGANMAERLFGDKSEKNRIRALALQDVYFDRFSIIRKWQKSVLNFVQDNRYVQSPTGRFLRLFGTPDEIAKVAIAFLGQGVGADHVQGIMLRFYRELGMVPNLQIHDELVFSIPKTLTNPQAVDMIRLMNGETNRLPGFTCPIEANRGVNWKEMDLIYKG